MSVEIVFGKLTTYRVNKPNDNNILLENLDDSNYTHIYSNLQILINGKVLPRMTYKGKDDVIMEYWIDELSHLLNSIKKTEKKYIIYGSEQGDPAFRFVRTGKTELISIIDCPIMEGKEDMRWQNIEVSIEDLREAFNSFKENFLETLEAEAPKIANKWSQHFEIR